MKSHHATDEQVAQFVSILLTEGENKAFRTVFPDRVAGSKYAARLANQFSKTAAVQAELKRVYAEMGKQGGEIYTRREMLKGVLDRAMGAVNANPAQVLAKVLSLSDIKDLPKVLTKDEQFAIKSIRVNSATGAIVACEVVCAEKWANLILNAVIADYEREQRQSEIGHAMSDKPVLLQSKEPVPKLTALPKKPAKKSAKKKAKQKR